MIIKYLINFHKNWYILFREFHGIPDPQAGIYHSLLLSTHITKKKKNLTFFQPYQRGQKARKRVSKKSDKTKTNEYFRNQLCVFLQTDFGWFWISWIQLFINNLEFSQIKKSGNRHNILFRKMDCLGLWLVSDFFKHFFWGYVIENIFLNRVSIFSLRCMCLEFLFLFIQVICKKIII